MVTPARLRVLLVSALLLSAALFAVGVAVERSQPRRGAAIEAAERVAVPSSSTGETAGERATEGSAAPAAPEAAGESVLGIDPESTALVVGAVAVSLLLAALVWRRPDSRGLLVVVALAALAFAVFDVREVMHQSDESRTGLAAIAALVAMLHLACAVIAALLARRPQGTARRQEAVPS